MLQKLNINLYSIIIISVQMFFFSKPVHVFVYHANY